MKINYLILIVLFVSNWSFGQSIHTSLPKKINKSDRYMFYLHGKIIEDKGVNGIHPDFGKYEYNKILDTLSNAGFVVISEARAKDTNPDLYAIKIVSQIDSLLKAKVSPENITVVGASKGAWISIIVSSKLQNAHVNFVFMGICGDDYDYSQEMFKVCGNVLSIYEKSDPLGTSCSKILNKNGCLTYSKEIELNLGVGHGFLYKPYKEWVIPVIEWARNKK